MFDFYLGMYQLIAILINLLPMLLMLVALLWIMIKVMKSFFRSVMK